MGEIDGRTPHEALARMRHDLRTPLAVILGLAQILESELGDDEHKEDVAHIIANGHKLQALIDDFVGLVRDLTDDGRPPA